MKILAAFDRYWRAPAPAARLGLTRLLVGLFCCIYLVARLPDWLAVARYHPGELAPVGPVALLLDRALLPAVVTLLAWLTVAASVPFFLGWRFRITGPLFGLLLLWQLSYRSSWGMIFHTENLLVLHVIILALVPSADAWSLDARRRPSPASADVRYGWPLKLMMAVVVLAYVLAGVAKLRGAGMGWVWGDALRNYVAIDNARKLLLGDVHSPLATPLLRAHWLFRALAAVTIVVELAAPLALLRRRFAAMWVGLVMAFHLGILGLMFILFPYQCLGFAYLCFFRLERVGNWLALRMPQLARLLGAFEPRE